MADYEEVRRKLDWWRRWLSPEPPRATEEEEEDDERRSLEEWDDLVEQRIQEAMRRGEFDDLSLKGQPLRFEENPFVDPAEALAHRLLAGQGFTLQWIEERKAIEAEIHALRVRLRRAWHWYMRSLEVLNHRDPDDPEVRDERAWTEARWQQYLVEFEEAIAELNRRIDTYNLTVPLIRFQMFRLRLQEELRSIGDGPSAEER